MKERVVKIGDKTYMSREWRMFEIFESDFNEDDYDYYDVLHYVSRTKKPVVQDTYSLEALFENYCKFNLCAFLCIKFGWLFAFKKKLYRYQKDMEPWSPKHRNRVGGPERKPMRELVNDGTLSPELDTVRVYWDCSSSVDIDEFIPSNASRSFRSVQRDPWGCIHNDMQFFRVDFMYSSWGTMLVSKENRKWGKNACHSRPVLCFEFSVAKWWNYASAVNSGMLPSSELILVPICDALKNLHIENFSKMSLDWLLKDLLDNAEIRRIDLSLNFRCPGEYTPTDYVQLMKHLRVNQQECVEHADGSISWASEKSPYRVICYDKEKEAKNYYTGNSVKGKKYVYYLDEKTGETYSDKEVLWGRVEDWWKLGLKRMEYDERKVKKDFYEKNKEYFKGNLRFEVQFRTKFFQEHNLMTMGRDSIDKCIRIAKFYWVEVLDQIDEQLNRANMTYSDKEPVADLLAKVQDDIKSGILSNTKGNNITGFIMQCYEDWRGVRERLGRNLFSMRRREVMKLYNYDVKIESQLPIMRIMSQVCISREGQMVQGYRLFPSPPVRLVANA